MRRRVYSDLMEWKEHGKKPLLVYGQRQIGKTYIIRKFAKENFSDFLYIDFSLEKKYHDVFESSNLSVDELILRLSTINHITNLKSEHFLLILDEIQDCDAAYSSLKAFAIDGRYKVIASGSMIGLSVGDMESKRISPMGYIETLEMHSMDFEEFLWSQNIPEESISYVRKCMIEKRGLGKAIMNEFSEQFRRYMVVGGMPESVASFNDDRTTFSNSSKVLNDILFQIYRDITKYNTPNNSIKTRECFDSIPSQLSETNKRFHYSRIDNNNNPKSRLAADRYMENILWIKFAGYGNFVYSLNQIASPLDGQVKRDLFKLYLSDTGLLIRMYGDAAASATFFSDTAFNLGAITENAIAEALMKCGFKPYYYQKNNGNDRMEIDFVIQFADGPVAIEVKSGKSRSAPSIRKVSSKFNVSKKIMFSNDDIGTDGDSILHLPLFCAAFVDCLDTERRLP